MTEIPTLTIVDDDELVCRSLKRIVSSSEYNVEVFASAEAFLNSNCLKDCNCLILDVSMPGMSGLELQRQLVIQRFQSPIIFITSQADECSKAQAMEAGAIGYLQKPFREEQLLDAIRQAFAAANEKG